MGFEPGTSNWANHCTTLRLNVMHFLWFDRRLKNWWKLFFPDSSSSHDKTIFRKVRPLLPFLSPC